MTPCPHIIIIIIISVSASHRSVVTAKESLRKEGCAVAFPCYLLSTICTPTFIFQACLSSFTTVYPKCDCYICLKYVNEKRHCTTLNK